MPDALSRAVRAVSARAGQGGRDAVQVPQGVVRLLLGQPGQDGVGAVLVALLHEPAGGSALQHVQRRHPRRRAAARHRDCDGGEEERSEVRGVCAAHALLRPAGREVPHLWPGDERLWLHTCRSAVLH